MNKNIKILCLLVLELNLTSVLSAFSAVKYLFFYDRVEFTDVEADSAFDAFVRIDLCAAF